MNGEMNCIRTGTDFDQQLCEPVERQRERERERDDCTMVVVWLLSGTYNNQYMVVDLKKVRLSRELTNGTLWVIEQIPGLVVGADQTTILRAGLFHAS